MKTSLLLLILFYGLSAQGQNMDIRAELSIGKSRRLLKEKGLSANVLAANNKYLQASDAVCFEISTTFYKKNCFFELGIGFQKMGFQYDEMLLNWPLDTGQNQQNIRYYTHRFREYYLSIPLRIGKTFKLNEKYKFDILTGLDPQFFLTGNAKRNFRREPSTSISGWNELTESIWTNPYVKPFNWYQIGLQWTAKVRYAIINRPKTKVSLSIQHRLNFITTQTVPTFFDALEQSTLGRIQSVSLGLCVSRKANIQFNPATF